MGYCKTYNFDIADFHINISFKDVLHDSIDLIPSFKVFLTSELTEKDLLFNLSVVSELEVPMTDLEEIRTFDTGNGDIKVDKTKTGSYVFEIKNLDNETCCRFISNNDFSDCSCKLYGNKYMRGFGLNNALMLIFAFAGNLKDTLLIHASLIRKNNYGYAFVAKSGTGKSTHTSLWLKHVPDCDLMNDDNPIIRIINGKAFIYGSPWSGKTPCYRAVKAKLGAVTRIERATENSIEKLATVKAFASLLPCCSSMKWDKKMYNAYCCTITKIIATTNIYILHCLPNKEAALLCHKEISK